MNLDDQVAAWAAHSGAAVDDVLAALLERRDRVLALSLARLRAGYGLYGDSMFRADDVDSERDLLEELADAVNYCVARRARALQGREPGSHRVNNPAAS